MCDIELQKFISAENITIVEAMQKINRNAKGIIFITDKEGKLTGSLTDGDIRRFVLSGGSLQSDVKNAVFRKPKYAYTAEVAERLYHEKNYVAIPITDTNLKVLDIYFGGEIKKNIKPSLKVAVVINAGGKGKRLDPYTRVLPKPLIPVGELPIIEHIMRQYLEFGCEVFHIIINYKKQLMKAYFAEEGSYYNISWYEEEQPLGTGGGLSLLKGKMHETFFFTNCDILLKSNYKNILEFHRKNKNVITMVCAYKNLTIPYGVVEMGENGIIEEIKEKPSLSFLTNTGMYVVEPEVLDDIDDEVPIDFPEVVKVQKEKGRNVAVYPISENEWMDMGQIPELDAMRKKLYGK